MKKLICAVLALVMLLTMTACGKLTERLSDDGVFYFGSKDGRKALETSINPLVPETVYAKIPATAKMLYGSFYLEEEEKNQEAFQQTAVFEELEYSYTYSIYTAEENKQTELLSTLPVRATIGLPFDYKATKMGTDHEWATLGFLNERGYTEYVFGSYTVSGNTFSFTPLEAYEETLNENYETTKISYSIGSKSIDYTFAFGGTSLTLTREGRSVTLKDSDFSNNTASMIDVGGYASAGSPKIDGLDYFSATLAKDISTVYLRDNNDNIFSSTYDNACIRMTEDGRLSMYWEETDEENNVIPHLKHFIYYPGTSYSITLTDGEKVYYYTDNYSTRSAVSLAVGMTEEEKEQLNALSEEQLAQIAEKKESLLDALAKACDEAGLNVSIDKATGEVALDTAVLFAVNESEISEEGKTFLQKFTQIYTSVVYSDEYEGFVSRILVEGHTDTSGSYELNKTLSQERADSVKTYCTSTECGIDSAYATAFAEALEAVGYAYDYPVYDADGNVDMDASRRVSFRFIVHIDAQ